MRFMVMALGMAALAATTFASNEASAHGWHRTCRHGLTDVHKHVKGVGRVECTTQRCYTNKWGQKRCSWS